MQTHEYFGANYNKKRNSDIFDGLAASQKLSRGGGRMPDSVAKKLWQISKNRMELQAKEGFVEKWHGLLDVKENKILRHVAMSNREARRRNKILTGTGFAWAQCDPIR